MPDPTRIEKVETFLWDRWLLVQDSLRGRHGTSASGRGACTAGSGRPEP